MVENSQHTTISYNLLLLREARRVLSSFKQDHIPVIVLKGIALAELVYPHIGMRAITDIDLLIKQEDSPLASRRLRELDYELKSGTAKHIKQGKPPLIVDYQTRIPYLSEKELWDKLMPISIDGQEGYTLSLEQNIIYLCYHLAVCHANSEQKWLEDIHRIITHFREEIDWHEMGSKIKNYRLDAPCYYTFLKIREVFRSPIPDYFISRIKPKNGLKARIFRQIFERPGPILYATRILPVLISPRLIFSRLFPSPRFLCLRYRTQPPLVYFYSLIWPACLFFKAMPGIVCLFLSVLRIVTKCKIRRYGGKAA